MDAFRCSIPRRKQYADAAAAADAKLKSKIVGRDRPFGPKKGTDVVPRNRGEIPFLIRGDSLTKTLETIPRDAAS